MPISHLGVRFGPRASNAVLGEISFLWLFVTVRSSDLCNGDVIGDCLIPLADFFGNVYNGAAFTIQPPVKNSVGTDASVGV